MTLRDSLVFWPTTTRTYVCTSCVRNGKRVQYRTYTHVMAGMGLMGSSLRTLETTHTRHTQQPKMNVHVWIVYMARLSSVLQQAGAKPGNRCGKDNNTAVPTAADEMNLAAPSECPSPSSKGPGTRHTRRSKPASTKRFRPSIHRSVVPFSLHIKLMNKT